jgi:hypothetical protein
MMGKWKKVGNNFSPNNKLVQEPEGNKEIRYPDPDSNKTKINYAKEPNEADQNNLKEKILQVSNKNFTENTGYGQPICTGDTQKISRQQK